RMVVFVPVSENVPPVEVNCTAVPSVTAVPFSVTVAVTVIVELTTTELPGETVRTIEAAVGGVVPGGVVVVAGGAVGDDSLLQPMASTSVAARRIVRMRSVVVFMRELLCAALAGVAEFERDGGRSRHALARDGFAEDFQRDAHPDDGPARLRISSGGVSH